MACAADDASGAARTAPPSIATIASNSPSERATLATEIAKKSPSSMNVPIRVTNPTEALFAKHDDARLPRSRRADLLRHFCIVSTGSLARAAQQRDRRKRQHYPTPIHHAPQFRTLGYLTKSTIRLQRHRQLSAAQLAQLAQLEAGFVYF